MKCTCEARKSASRPRLKRGSASLCDLLVASHQSDNLPSPKFVFTRGCAQYSNPKLRYSVTQSSHVQASLQRWLPWRFERASILAHLPSSRRARPYIYAISPSGLFFKVDRILTIVNLLLELSSSSPPDVYHYHYVATMMQFTMRMHC